MENKKENNGKNSLTDRVKRWEGRRRGQWTWKHRPSHRNKTIDAVLVGNKVGVGMASVRALHESAEKDLAILNKYLETDTNNEINLLSPIQKNISNNDINNDEDVDICLKVKHDIQNRIKRRRNIDKFNRDKSERVSKLRQELGLYRKKNKKKNIQYNNFNPENMYSHKRHEISLRKQKKNKRREDRKEKKNRKFQARPLPNYLFEQRPKTASYNLKKIKKTKKKLMDIEHQYAALGLSPRHAKPPTLITSPDSSYQPLNISNISDNSDFLNDIINDNNDYNYFNRLDDDNDNINNINNSDNNLNDSNNDFIYKMNNLTIDTNYDNDSDYLPNINEKQNVIISPRSGRPLGTLLKKTMLQRQKDFIKTKEERIQEGQKILKEKELEGLVLKPDISAAKSSWEIAKIQHEKALKKQEREEKKRKDLENMRNLAKEMKLKESIPYNLQKKNKKKKGKRKISKKKKKKRTDTTSSPILSRADIFELAAEKKKKKKKKDNDVININNMISEWESNETNENEIILLNDSLDFNHLNIHQLSHINNNNNNNNNDDDDDDKNDDDNINENENNNNNNNNESENNENNNKYENIDDEDKNENKNNLNELNKKVDELLNKNVNNNEIHKEEDYFCDHFIRYNRGEINNLFDEKASTSDSGRLRIRDVRLYDSSTIIRRRDNIFKGITYLCGKRLNSNNSKEDILIIMFDLQLFNEESATKWWNQNKNNIINVN